MFENFKTKKKQNIIEAIKKNTRRIGWQELEKDSNPIMKLCYFLWKPVVSVSYFLVKTNEYCAIDLQHIIISIVEMTKYANALADQKLLSNIAMAHNLMLWILSTVQVVLLDLGAKWSTNFVLKFCIAFIRYAKLNFQVILFSEHTHSEPLV